MSMRYIIKCAEKFNKCWDFFNELSYLLSEQYEIVKSCNQDLSRYLIPKGTIDELTYTGKPIKSFRLSDHWNWYSNLKKCPDENYIQCFSTGAPNAKRRTEPGKATSPVTAIQVCLYCKDGKYRCVYGERFNKNTKQWEWIESDPKDIINRYGLF